MFGINTTKKNRTFTAAVRATLHAQVIAMSVSQPAVRHGLGGRDGGYILHFFHEEDMSPD